MTGTGPQTDKQAAAIARVAGWLQLLADPDDIVEIRALQCSTPSYRRPHARTGFYDFFHLADAAKAALELSQSNVAKGIYFTLNPVNSDLLARRCNRLDVAGDVSPATDRDITARRWLLVDADPVRIAGVSSTDAEKAAAKKTIMEIGQALADAGWSPPIIADSGNGWHLLYRIDLPNDDESTALVKQCLHALAHRFGSAEVDIDTTVFNASRICKLYGTISRKGDHTPERPHRRSQVTYVPVKIKPNPRDLLQALADTAPPPPAPSTNGHSHANGSPAPRHVVIERARKYALKCKPAVAGQHGHDQAFHIASILTHGFALSPADALPILQEWNATCEPPWSERDLLHKLEDAAKAPGPRGELIGTAGNGQSPTPSMRDLAAMVEFVGVPAASGATAAHPATSGEALANPPEPSLMGTVIEADDDPHRLARLFVRQHIRSDHLTLRYWRESFWRWDGRRYVKIPTYQVRAEITNSIKAEFDRINIERQAWAPKLDKAGNPVPPEKAQKVTTALTTNVLQAVQGITLLEESIEQPSWLGMPHRDRNNFIAMANGILDLQALLGADPADPEPPDPLLPHSPLWFSPVCLGFDYRPDAEFPMWLRFVEHNLEGDADRIDMLQEFFGYCLTADTSLQKFMILEGEGSNGKSVVCAVLTALLDPDNVSHVPLEIWGSEFALTQTLGKLANIASEVGDLDKIAEGHLKAFTAGDRMTFNRKNQSLIEATPTARLLIATNNRPRFSDRSGGIWRRMLLLPFRVQIADEDKVYGMDQAAWWQRSGELPGIFLWAIEGLKRLRRFRRFTEAAISRDAILEYREENNPALQFLLEHFEYGTQQDDVVTSEVYKDYSDWCERSGYRRLGARQFGKEIVRAFPKAEHAKVWASDSKRVNGYRYIRARSSFSSDTSDTPDIENGDDSF